MSDEAPLTLATLHARCFQGVVPSVLATADAAFVPNVTYVSQVVRVDDAHVGLSHQFFNKTARNLEQNPRAAIELYDPLTFEAWRLRLLKLRSETSGPLFDSMALRIQAIASQTGVSGVFSLKAADVFRVESVRPVLGFRGASDLPWPDVPLPPAGARSELRGLLWVSQRISRATDASGMLAGVLEALEAYFGFRHAMVLLADEQRGRLVMLASSGYGDASAGVEVAFDGGLIGTVARERRVLRISSLDQELSYGRAIRRQALSVAELATPAEVPLPGLPDARSALVIPLVAGDRLLGVLAAESRNPARFDEWHEAYLEVLGTQIAMGLDRMIERGALASESGRAAATAASGTGSGEDSTGSGSGSDGSGVPTEPPSRAVTRHHRFVFYRNDDCVFVDGEYLIRNVPGRILWKLLRQHREGRTAFTNRELRLDPSLGLPGLRDNLESRLVLLRRRLEQRCPDLRLVSTGRGRFRLEIESTLELQERDSA